MKMILKEKNNFKVLIDNLILRIVRSEKIDDVTDEIELLKWLIKRELYK